MVKCVRKRQLKIKFSFSRISEIDEQIFFFQCRQTSTRKKGRNKEKIAIISPFVEISYPFGKKLTVHPSFNRNSNASGIPFLRHEHVQKGGFRCKLLFEVLTLLSLSLSLSLSLERTCDKPSICLIPEAVF